MNLTSEMQKLDQHIVLDPETHIYTVNGIPKRSLSSILEPLKEPFPELAYERVVNAKHRGTQIDDACSLIMEGKFTSLHDELLADEARPYVGAFRQCYAREWFRTDPAARADAALLRRARLLLHARLARPPRPSTT